VDQINISNNIFPKIFLQYFQQYISKKKFPRKNFQEKISKKKFPPRKNFQEKISKKKFCGKNIVEIFFGNFRACMQKFAGSHWIGRRYRTDST
jgi:hypothetical protein